MIQIYACSQRLVVIVTLCEGTFLHKQSNRLLYHNIATKFIFASGRLSTVESLDLCRKHVFDETKPVFYKFYFIMYFTLRRKPTENQFQHGRICLAQDKVTRIIVYYSKLRLLRSFYFVFIRHYVNISRKNPRKKGPSVVA